MNETQNVEVVYDGKCPVCRGYCERLKLADPQRNLVLFDARRPGETVTEVYRRGLDINEGMAVTVDGRLYYGSRAIHELTRLAEAESMFGRLNRLAFGSRRLSRYTYPFGKLARNILLRLIGVEKIRHPEPDDAATSASTIRKAARDR